MDAKTFWMMVLVLVAVLGMSGMSGCATVCQVADGVGPAPIVQAVICADGRQEAR